MIITKSIYTDYRECAKNTWVKIHQPELYKQLENIPAFKRMLMKGGIEVDSFSHNLYPFGYVVEGRGKGAQEQTKKLLDQKTPIIFQAELCFGNFSAAIDILEYHPETNSYSVMEVKASNEVKDKYLYDVTFQVNVLKMCGLVIDQVYIVHLNREYIRNGRLNPQSIFKKENVTERVNELMEEVKADMHNALYYLSQKSLPSGFCSCVYLGNRNDRCATYSFHNTLIPERSVHDISNIRQKKLEELIDDGIYTIEEIPDNFPLSDRQQNQVSSHKANIVIVDKFEIAKELDSLEFPLYFIDYETINPALPRYDGYSPYKHVPFQYSLYILETPTSEPQHFEFLHDENSDPTYSFVESLKKHIGPKGRIIVWHEPFEMGRNEDIAKHIPEVADFMADFNKRIFDLKKIFSKQLYIHKDFHGSASIKKVLPVLCPSLSYKELGIQDGVMALEAWNKLTTEDISEEEKQKIIQDLKKYCGLDAYAMYAIWKQLQQEIIKKEIKILDLKNEKQIAHSEFS